MAQRRHHYERAFENYLRARRIPYIAVDEAKKTLLPDRAPLRIENDSKTEQLTLKSFDFVIYGGRANFLIDVKGRRVPRNLTSPLARGRLESWVTQDDVDSMRQWERLFGRGFEGAFLFIYWCEGQPPDALFQEMFEDRGRWYAIRVVRANAYFEHMRVRSPRWRTVHLAATDFERLSQPLLEAAR
ncbi:MAG: HYExAFE family protein [Phycisphaerae bacterium]|nr:HYExAFE family protein [Phycisphaerae bacterium]